jgi:hypothetical protein
MTSPTRLRCTASLPLTILVLGLLNGCAAPSGSSGTTGAMSDPGREAFQAIPLPDGNAFGADPQALAQSLYGSAAPVEGNYSEEILTLSDSGSAQVLLFTQLGLADDSLRGMRYRLELLRHGGQWQLTWAGRQVSCWPGRGHEDWSTAPCL